MLPLVSLDELLAPILAQVEPVAPVAASAEAAVGLVVGRPVHTPEPLPARTIALRAGLAVASLDLVGASSHTPALLPSSLPALRIGDALPPGCDAVIDPQAAVASGAFTEVSAGAAPGDGVRIAGHDLSASAMIAAAGHIWTPEMQLAAALAGISTIEVRAPVVRLVLPDGPERRWLHQRLTGLGCVLDDARRPDLLLIASDAQAPRLAFTPAETAWASCADGVPAVMLPPRFEGVAASFVGLVLPIVARLQARGSRIVSSELSGKLVSSVGSTELALFRVTGSTAIPLAVGDLPLRAISASDAFTLVPAGSEGMPAGERIALQSWAEPLGPQESAS